MVIIPNNHCHSELVEHMFFYPYIPCHSEPTIVGEESN